MDEGDLHPTDAAPPRSFGPAWPPPRREWTARDAAFVAAIREDLDDDVPRLVYADWLLDQGDPRGLFIHLDIACLYEDDPLRLRMLLRDRKRVLQRYEEYWSPGDKVTAIGGFTRGFLEAVTMTPTEVWVHGDVVFAREPIHELRLRCETGSPGLSITTCRCLELIRRLRIEFDPEAHWLSQVLWLPALAQVNALTLRPVRDGAVVPHQVSTLAGGPMFPRLRALRLPGLGLLGLRSLLDARGFAVERLEVPGRQREDTGPRDWDDESPAVIDVPSIGREGLELLLEHPAARSLVYLDASYNPVSLVLDRIARSENLANLRTIRVAERREIDLVAVRARL